MSRKTVKDLKEWLNGFDDGFLVYSHCCSGGAEEFMVTNPDEGLRGVEFFKFECDTDDDELSAMYSTLSKRP